MKAVVLILAMAVGVLAQDSLLPDTVKSAKTVFLQNETGDKWVPWSAEQVLRGSRLHAVTTHEAADLVFHFTLVTEPTQPLSVTSNATVPIRNTFFLEVVNNKGVTVWKQSEDFHDPDTQTPFLKPMGTSAKARADFLLAHPPAALVDRFLKQLSTKQSTPVR
jgi:hypothetical protein